MSSIGVDEFAAPSGSSFKFDTLGAQISGTVAYVGSWEEQPDKYKGGVRTVLKLGIDTGNDEVLYVYPAKGSVMAQAIGEALRDAKLAKLEVGQKLSLQHHDTKDTGKPQPLKLFRAKVEAGAASAPADDFWSS